MAYLATTTRVRGLYGAAYFGDTAKASDVYAGAEIKNWAIRLAVATEDATALSEFDSVKMAVQREGSFSCSKFLVTASLMARILTDPVVYVALYHGRAQTATTGIGSIAVQGMVILTSFDASNDRGPVLINVGGDFTGTISTS